MHKSWSFLDWKNNEIIVSQGGYTSTGCAQQQPVTEAAMLFSPCLDISLGECTGPYDSVRNCKGNNKRTTPGDHFGVQKKQRMSLWDREISSFQAVVDALRYDSNLQRIVNIVRVGSNLTKVGKLNFDFLCHLRPTRDNAAS